MITVDKCAFGRYTVRLGDIPVIVFVLDPQTAYWHASISPSVTNQNVRQLGCQQWPSIGAALGDLMRLYAESRGDE